MSSEKSLAIVIRRIEFSETSYVATLFTEDFGKLTAMAKGARRPKSAFENALDLLSISRVVFLRKSSGAMDLLTEARLELPFRAARHDLNALHAGYYIAELLMILTDDHDPFPQVFRTARQTLENLQGACDIGEQILRFELTTLKELGHLPGLDTCTVCGAAMDDSKSRVYFGQLAGGVLCPRCRSGQRHVVSLSRTAVEVLRRMSRQQDVDRKQLDSVRGELRGLLNNYLSHLIGRRPKLYTFLTSIR